MPKSKSRPTRTAKPKRTAAPKRAAAPQGTPARKRAAKPSPKRTPARPPARARGAGRSDDADAFIPDPGEGPARAPDVLAEVLAEDYIAAATSGEDVLDDDLDAFVPEEVGGPFVPTTAAEELADDVDASNPPGATREPLPRAVSGLAKRPRDA